MRSEERVARLRQRMEREGARAFAAVDVSNITYLTGFDGVFDEERAHLALITPDACTLYTDNRYAEAATAAAAGSGWAVRAVWPDVSSVVAEDLVASGEHALLLEDTISVRRLGGWEDLGGLEVSTCRDWVETLRAVKESAEIERIEAAQRLTDEAFEHVLGAVREGMTESEIALEIEFYMRRNGSEGVAFPPIVASGPNSALPHARPTDRRLARGDFLKMDFGAKVQGYCADMTRTVVIGKASERQKEVYHAVLRANRAGIAAVSAGKAGREIDAAARSVLEDAGLGTLFTHGLGHGVGLQVHEAPGVGPRAEAPVSESSVITIEPGVYEPGVGGVRIEDLVVVEASGARVLARSTKDLIEL